MLNAVNRVCLLSLMNPHIMLVEYGMYSCLFIFIILEKSRMGTRLPEIRADRLVINESVVPVEWSLHLFCSSLTLTYPLEGQLGTKTYKT
jgi:hypothetical protein